MCCYLALVSIFFLVFWNPDQDRIEQNLADQNLHNPASNHLNRAMLYISMEILNSMGSGEQNYRLFASHTK